MFWTKNKLTKQGKQTNKQTEKTVVILYFKDSNLKKQKKGQEIKKYSTKPSFSPPKFRTVDSGC